MTQRSRRKTGCLALCTLWQNKRQKKCDGCGLGGRCVRKSKFENSKFENPKRGAAIAQPTGGRIQFCRRRRKVENAITATPMISIAHVEGSGIEAAV
jgi:hypothetical protein